MFGFQISVKYTSSVTVSDKVEWKWRVGTVCLFICGEFEKEKRKTISGALTLQQKEVAT